MVSRRRSRDSVAKFAKDISSISSALAKVQRLTGTTAITMARKIGFSVGVELARGTGSSHSDIHTELSSLSRKLNLGRVAVHEWSPVVFVTHSDARAEDPEAAFGDGVLEGVMYARLGRQVFVKHSTLFEKRNPEATFRRKPRSVRIADQ